MAYSKIDTIRYLRESGNVERAHNMPHHGSYSVGKHCYDMVVLLFQLYPGIPSRALVEAIIYHDAAERTTGDIPAPAKWSNPEMTRHYEEAADRVDSFLGIESNLDYEDRKWLKALDAFEFYLWCLDQVAFGNQNAQNCHRQITVYLDTVAEMPNEVREMYLEYRNTGWKRTDEQLPAVPSRTGGE